MPEAEVSVLWVCGAPGAGKSAAAWGLFEALAADGVPAGYVDIDQLGMLYPAGKDDPERHLLKAEALVALLPGYAAAGAQVLVVSGVVDARVGPAAVLADVDLRLCLLRPEPGVLRERISARGGWGNEEVVEALAEDAALRAATFVDVAIDTAGLSVDQTVNRLSSLVRVPDRSSHAASPPVVRSHSAMGVAVVTGPRAVGSSTAGFGLAMARWRAHRRTAFVDLQQLAFLACPGSPRRPAPALAITQLAIMHAFMAARGAGLLVVSGHLHVTDRDALRAALPAAPVTVVRLRADATTLEAHVCERVTGSAARLSGDDLIGARPEHQAAVIAAAIAEQEHLDAEATDDAILDVTGRTPAETVADLQRLVAAAGGL